MLHIQLLMLMVFDCSERDFWRTMLDLVMANLDHLLTMGDLLSTTRSVAVSFTSRQLYCCFDILE